MVGWSLMLLAIFVVSFSRSTEKVNPDKTTNMEIDLLNWNKLIYLDKGFVSLISTPENFKVTNKFPFLTFLGFYGRIPLSQIRDQRPTDP